jgi:hypothetical protein
MGGGNYRTDVHTTRTAAKLAAGKDIFDHDSYVRRTGDYSVHETLDPKTIAGIKSPFAGKVMRESRDSDEHPESLPIAVLFDVTGSMGSIPRVLQTKLPKLHGLLLQKGYVEHPQILFGAIGDAYVDRIPLQIGQFESDNRMDENLENFILEGGGGGQTHESYQLGAYFVARHTDTDAWTKRGKRGYLFFIGDERSYKDISRQQVKKLISDDGLEKDLSTEEIFAELKEKWDVYFLFAAQGSYAAETIIDTDNTYPGDLGVGWRKLLGQNALVLEDADAVCETIALTIGLGEGTIDLDAGLAHLRDLNTDDGTITTVSKALAPVAAGIAPVAVASGSLPPATDEEDGAERL